MDVHLLFGVSALLSLVSSAVLAALYLWPFLRVMDRESVAPHMFWRFMGLSFLVPGVVSPSHALVFWLLVQTRWQRADGSSGRV
jgi:hypothetical protein